MNLTSSIKELYHDYLSKGLIALLLELKNGLFAKSSIRFIIELKDDININMDQIVS